MKKDHKEKLLRVEEAIIAAHRGRNPPRLTDSFERAVMSDIRKIRRPVRQDAVAENGSVQRIVWRFAAAACLLAVISLGWFIKADTGAVQYEVAEFVSGESSSIILAQAMSAFEPLEAEP
jgi:hypothetical protein